MQLPIDKKLQKSYFKIKSCINATNKDAFLRMEEDKMLEVKYGKAMMGPRIVVIGVGGGGNNA